MTTPNLIVSGPNTNFMYDVATRGQGNTLSSRLRVDAVGNVGFGVAPQYNVDMGGDLRVIGNLYANLIVSNSVSGSSSANGANTLYVSNYLGVATAPTNAYPLDVSGAVRVRGTSGNTGLVVTAGGNVGVGLSNPQYALDVAGQPNFSLPPQNMAVGNLLVRAFDISNDGANVSTMLSPSQFVGCRGKPCLTGVSNVMTLYSFTNPNNANGDCYTLRYNGFVKFPAADTYVFYLFADDSARVTINNQFVVWSSYQQQNTSANVYLNAGWNPLCCEFVQTFGGQALTLQYKSATVANSVFTTLQHGVGNVQFAYDAMDNAPSRLGTTFVDGALAVNTVQPAFQVHAQPTSSDYPAINPDAINTPIIYEDCQSNVLTTGVLTGNAMPANANAQYVTLTPNTNSQTGSVLWSYNPGTAWDLTYEYNITNGSATPADAICFVAYANNATQALTSYMYTGTPTGYQLTVSEYQSKVFLYYGTTLLQSQAFTVPLGAWTQVRLSFVRNVWKVWVGGFLALTYQDIRRNLVGPGTNTMYLQGSTGGANATHAVRYIVMTKHVQGHWRSVAGGAQTSIAYHGNVGIFQPNPQYALDVVGQPNFTLPAQNLAVGNLLVRAFDLNLDVYSLPGQFFGCRGRPFATTVANTMSLVTPVNPTNPTGAYYALRYTGFIQFPTAGTYTFYLGADDAARLTLNNQYVTTSNGTANVYVSNTGGAWTPICCEYYQGYGGQYLTLQYKSANVANATFTQLQHGVGNLQFAYDVLDSAPSRLGTTFVDGALALNTPQPNFQVHAQPLTTDNPAVNPDAYNTLIVYEDCQSSTLTSGMLTGYAIAPSANVQYLTLTPPQANQSGSIYWSYNPGTAWDLTFEYFIGPYGGGGLADGLTLVVYASGPPASGTSIYTSNAGAYQLTINELYSSVTLYYGSTTLLAQTFTVPTQAWTQIRVSFVRNVWKVWIGSALALTFQDVRRPLVGSANNTMFLQASGGANYALHAVRYIQLTKHVQGHWRSTAGGAQSAIAYHGNVGISQANPQYNLDVAGTARVTGNLTAPTAYFTGPAVGGPPIANNAQGERVVYYTNTPFDLATGVENSYLWNSVPAGNGYKWYVNGGERMRIDSGTGNLLYSGNFVCTGSASAVGSLGVSGTQGSAMYVYNQQQASGTNGWALYQGTGGDTVLNSASGQPMLFKINNTEYGRFSSAGLLGLGNTSPGQQLEVTGTARLNGTSGVLIVDKGSGTTAVPATNVSGVPSTGERLVLWNNIANTYNYSVGIEPNNMWQSVPSGAGIKWYQGGTERLRLDPSGPFNVYTGMYCNSLLSFNAGASGTYGIQWNSGTSSKIIDDGDLRISTDDNMHFYTGLTSTSLGSEKLSIGSSGCVGINQGSPGYQLDVNGPTRISSGGLWFNNQQVNQVLALWTNDSSPSTGSTNFYGFGIGQNTMRYQVPATNGTYYHTWYTGGTQLMTLYPSTLNLSTNLVVSYSASQGGVVQILVQNTGNGGGSCVDFQTYNGQSPVGGRVACWDSGNFGSYMTFSTRSDTSSGSLKEAMRITQTGAVGIGTTSPSYILDVNGTSRLSNGSLWFNNQVNNQMLALYTNDSSLNTGSTNFYGLGMGGGTLRYQVPSANGPYYHTWYAGTNQMMTLSSTAQTLNFPTNYGITWGTCPFSRIVDDGDLHIATDDYMHFNIGGSISTGYGTEILQINSGGLYVSGQITQTYCVSWWYTQTQNSGTNSGTIGAPTSMFTYKNNNNGGTNLMSAKGNVSNPSTASITFPQSGVYSLSWAVRFNSTVTTENTIWFAVGYSSYYGETGSINANSTRLGCISTSSYNSCSNYTGYFASGDYVFLLAYSSASNTLITGYGLQSLSVTLLQKTA